MRKPRGSDKTLGYIVVPLFLEQKGEETLEQALDRSDFSDVADVLNALQEQDEDLIAIVRELQEAKGRGEAFDPRRLAEKVEVLGPTIEFSTLRANILAEIIETIGVTWDVWFGCLKAYKGREGHCRVPHDHKDNGFRLGVWVDNQRRNKDKMSDDRRCRLDELGFVWNAIELFWEEGFNHLSNYRRREGHCRVPTQHNESGYRLGGWVNHQRVKRNTISLERRKRLDSLGFIWDPLDADWENGFVDLSGFKTREGHCRVPVDHKEGEFKLGFWVSSQREKRDAMHVERRNQLDELGFVWNPLEADWEEGIGRLEIYAKREAHCLVPIDYCENGFRLGHWVSRQRLTKKGIPADRRQRLDKLGFVWDPLEEAWERGFAHLSVFKGREGHCRVPDDHIENGFRLGKWVGKQRAKKGMLPQRWKRLTELGFVWSVTSDQWEVGFRGLKQYKEREGHCRVHPKQEENGFKLGIWVITQRQTKKNMPVDRQRRLNALGFVWNPREAAWEQGLAHLTAFQNREGHCLVPQRFNVDGFELGRWVSKQRAKRNILLTNQQRKKLDELGFVWKVR